MLVTLITKTENLSCFHPNRLKSLSFPWGKSLLQDICYVISMCAKSDCTQSGTCRTSSYFFISAYFSIYHEPLLRQITGNWLSWCCIVLKLPVALSGLFICFCFLLSWSPVFALCLSTSRAAQFCSMLQSRLHFFFSRVQLPADSCLWLTDPGARA